MPEYLAPGVYVEETSFRSKSIEGVSTSTTAFVGATRYGPTEGEPELMTSFNQFERIYGGLDPLNYGGTEVQNYLAHAVRAFFDNGGSRLYIARTYTPLAGETGEAVAPIPAPVQAIRDAERAAQDATARVLSSLNEATAELTRAKAAAITVLRFAADQVIAARNVATPAPEITYDYEEDDNVAAQLTSFIDGLTDEDEQTAVQAVLTAIQDLIDSADTAYANAHAALADASTSQTNLSGAYASGVMAGEAVLDTALPSNPGVDAAATLTPLNNVVNTVMAEVDDLAPLSDTLTTGLTAMEDAATADAVITQAEELTTAAAEVIAAAGNVVTPVRNAARQSTIGRRATLRNAQATLRARFPGDAGNMTVTITGRLGANVLTTQSNQPAVTQIRAGDLVVIQRGDNAFIYSAGRANGSWSFTDGDATPLALASLAPNNDSVYPLTLSVEVHMSGRFAQPLVWSNLTISPLASRLRDSVTQVFAAAISNRMQELETPLVLDPRNLLPPTLAGHLIGLTDWQEKLSADQRAADWFISATTFELTGGSDGARPEASAYEGQGGEDTVLKSGLKSLEDLEEISIVAAPGYSHDYSARSVEINQINQHLITHCENMRYRVAVLDSPNDQSLSGVRNYRAVLDSTRAALYYPWVRILDPITNQPLDVPPSGFLTGIFARNDVENGVHKAPANEVVRGAIGLEVLINKAQQDVLNPLGIDCIRLFEGRGIRVWGARTISSDPEWKYLNIRRYFIYLEASIDRSTQWAVFEPNGEALWANIRRTVSDFLYNEWKEERLAGTRPEEAFFVRCDRSTMTQNDLDNGRLICLIGVAPLYPAEFVIFRIGQWTADSRS